MTSGDKIVISLVIIAGACAIAALIWWGVKSERDYNDGLRACLNAGYAGRVQFETVPLCVGANHDGEWKAEPLDDVRARMGE